MYLRNFEGIVSGLADRGYKIFITTSPKDRKVPRELRELARQLEERHPQRVSFGITYERDDWLAPASRFGDVRICLTGLCPSAYDLRLSQVIKISD